MARWLYPSLSLLDGCVQITAAAPCPREAALAASLEGQRCPCWVSSFPQRRDIPGGGLLKPSCREGDGKRPPSRPLSPLPWADSNILPSVERPLHMIKEIHAHCENVNK